MADGCCRISRAAFAGGGRNWSSEVVSQFEKYTITAVVTSTAQKSSNLLLFVIW